MCVGGESTKQVGGTGYTDLHKGQKSGTTEFDSAILAIEIPLLRSSYCIESSRKLTWASIQAKSLSHTILDNVNTWESFMSFVTLLS